MSRRLPMGNHAIVLLEPDERIIDHCELGDVAVVRYRDDAYAWIPVGDSIQLSDFHFPYPTLDEALAAARAAIHERST